MNDIIKDFKEENFTKKEWLLYGVVMPIALVQIAILCS